MIIIDAREGVASDMLLGAMLGGLGGSARVRAATSIEYACAGHNLAFHCTELHEDGDKGIGISYQSIGPESYGTSKDECFSRLSVLEHELGSDSPIAGTILGHIFDAEAEAHGIPVDEVHLHEIGRTQALMNMAGIGMLAPLLTDGPDDAFLSSEITTGGGFVVVSHGAIRIPAPASAILLIGMKYRPGDSPGERATPTGIAAIKALAAGQVEHVPDTFEKRSVGFGTKRFSGRLGRTSLLWV